MCKAIEDAILERNYLKSVEIATNLLKIEALSKEEIAQSCGLSLEDVEELASQLDTD